LQAHFPLRSCNRVGVPLHESSMYHSNMTSAPSAEHEATNDLPTETSGAPAFAATHVLMGTVGMSVHVQQ
jgi:hypothetical protein